MIFGLAAVVLGAAQHPRLAIGLAGLAALNLGLNLAFERPSERRR